MPGGGGLSSAAAEMGVDEGELRDWMAAPPPSAGGRGVRGPLPAKVETEIELAARAWVRNRAVSGLEALPAVKEEVGSKAPAADSAGHAVSAGTGSPDATERAARLAEGLKGVQAAAIAQGHPPMEPAFLERLTELFIAVPVAREMPEHLRPESRELLHPYTGALLQHRAKLLSGGGK